MELYGYSNQPGLSSAEYEELLNKEESMQTAQVITGPVGVGKGAIEAPAMSGEQASEVVKNIVERFLVKTSPNAPSCCIDGRCARCRLDGSEPLPGPKVAGGGLTTAYAAAELVGWFEDTDSTDVITRMQLVKDKLEVAGLKTGGHCDTAAKDSNFDGKTGCGANDKLPVIIKNFTDPMISQFIVDNTGVFFEGDTYKAEHAEAAVCAAVQNPVSEADWKARAMIDILGGENSPCIEELESQADATSGHHEVMVILNPNRNTTVDRDALFRELGIQVFVVDTWYLDDLADAMSRGTDGQIQKEALQHVMAAYQLATYATLGNGSHRVAKLAEIEQLQAA